MAAPNDDSVIAIGNDPDAARYRRHRLIWEVWIVLAVTIGQSALYSVIALLRRLTADVPLGQQQTQLNPSRDQMVFWDVLYQVLSVVFDLALVALMIYLLWEPRRSAFRRIGLDFTRIGSDLLRGLALAAAIGIPGLGLYVVGRSLGLTVAVVASPLDAAWWTVPLLIFSALRAALLEEVFLAYFVDRMRRLGWSWWPVILTAAGIRAAYHAYQGFGGIIGNFVLGVVFGWCYKRWGRIMPLVIAHAVLDIVAFVGYPLAASLWPGVFGPVPSPTPSPTPTPTPTPGA